MRRTNKEQTHAPDGSFSMKLGSTTYSVAIYFNEKSNATLQDKLKNLLTAEVHAQRALVLE